MERLGGGNFGDMYKVIKRDDRCRFEKIKGNQHIFVTYKYSPILNLKNLEEKPLFYSNVTIKSK